MAMGIFQASATVGVGGGNGTSHIGVTRDMGGLPCGAVGDRGGVLFCLEIGAAGGGAGGGVFGGAGAGGFVCLYV